METKEFKRGSKYFSNVEKVVNSVKKINSSSSFKFVTNNEKLMMNMIKSLATIIDTQNDILKYIISHDSKAIIEESTDIFTPGQFVLYKEYDTIAVIKELVSNETVKIHIIAQSIDKEVNIKEIE